MGGSMKKILIFILKTLYFIISIIILPFEFIKSTLHFYYSKLVVSQMTDEEWLQAFKDSGYFDNVEKELNNMEVKESKEAMEIICDKCGHMIRDINKGCENCE